MSFRAVLSTPGAKGFIGAGLALRLPQAMYPVGLVLLASLTSGDYTFGSVLTASFILGNAVGNPTLSRAADRWGQARVLRISALGQVAFVIGLIIASQAHAHPSVQVVVAAFVGVSFVPGSALVRARWVHVLNAKPDQLTTALSFESIVDEGIFVVGPVVAAGVATLLSPAAPFGLIALLVVAGSAGLSMLRSTAPPAMAPSRDRSAGTPQLPWLPVTAVVLIAIATGVTLIGVDLVAITFVGQAGKPTYTGIVVGLFALGSGVAGIAYGSLRWRRPVHDRLAYVGALFCVLPLLLLTADNVPVLALVMFIVGLGTAPLLITLFGLMDQLSAPARKTEAMAWVTTGLGIGAGIAAPAVGALADAQGARTAMLVPISAAIVAGAIAQVTARLMRPSRSTAK